MSYIGLRPVPLAVEREVLASFFSLPAPFEPAIATSEGYRRGLEQLRLRAERVIQDHDVRALLMRRGLP